MDVVSKVLDWIKVGFANRFVTYYIVYWLLFNWRITVALFWYDTTQIEAEGCQSTFEFITDQLENNSHWCLVFIYSLISTLLFPIIKMLIFVFDTNVRISRSNWISRVENDELSQQNTILRNVISDINNKRFLNGRWRVNIIPDDYKNSSEDYHSNFIYKIKDSMVTVVDEGEDYLDKYTVTDFCFTQLSNQKNIFMKMDLMRNYQEGNYNMKTLQKRFILFLTVEDDGMGRIKMTGTQNHDIIEFLKLD